MVIPHNIIKKTTKTVVAGLSTPKSRFDPRPLQIPGFVVDKWHYDMGA
jgi:hypothetical protein